MLSKYFQLLNPFHAMINYKQRILEKFFFLISRTNSAEVVPVFSCSCVSPRSCSFLDEVGRFLGEVRVELLGCDISRYEVDLVRSDLVVVTGRARSDSIGWWCLESSIQFAHFPANRSMTRSIESALSTTPNLEWLRTTL